VLHIVVLGLLLQTTAADVHRTTSVIVVSIDPDYLHPNIQRPDLEPTFTLTSLEDGVNFDVDGDGTLERVSWTERGADVAFLAIDTDHDGRITSGQELFGDHMRPGVTTGADALIQTFSDLNGELEGSVVNGHSLYERLLLWTDRNHNGISEASEIQQAHDLFTSIGMGFVRLNTTPDQHGNVFRLRGWTEVRTAGMAQSRALTPQDHFPRVRQMFEVRLRVSP
jgi:hypothetical protein